MVDLILYSVPNMLHAQHHVGKRLKQNALLGYVACDITVSLLVDKNMRALSLVVT